MRRSSKPIRPSGKMDSEVLTLRLLGNCELLLGATMFGLNVFVVYTLPYTRFVHFHTGYFLVAGLQVISGLTAITAITSHTTHEETRRLLPLHLQGSVSALVFFCFLFTALILTSALSLPSFIINITRKELRAYRADEHTLRAACTAIYWLCYISVAVLFSSAGLAWYLLQNITEVYRLPRSAGMQTPINMFARGSLGTDKPKARGLLMY